MSEVTEAEKIYGVDKQSMANILSAQLSEGHAIGLWRLPQSTKKNLIVSTEGIRQLDELVIEEVGTGFVFAPFDSERKKMFLKADAIYTFEKGEITSTNSSFEPLEASVLKKKLTSEDLHFHKSPYYKKTDFDSTQFIELVNKSMDTIATGPLEKLVPSRCQEVSLPASFDLIDLFNKLCQQYPDAFVSLVSSLETGTWIGASPELLVSVDERMRFRTAAVAGTQRLDPETDIRQVSWTQKEIEEQALVNRYIISCFKKIRLREYEEHGPKTWKAGNLLHLRTDFEVDTTATNFPQLGTVMLKLLHPTSAVCGMPREESLKFLKENEHFDRQFYSGYLGPVNFQNETHLFVNLRCMQWNDEKALLYAGAGVTLDSIPQKEWEETEMKMKTLLQVIQS